MVRRYAVLLSAAVCSAAVAVVFAQSTFAHTIERLFFSVPPASAWGRMDLALLTLLSVVLAVTTFVYPLRTRSLLFVVLGLECYGLALYARRPDAAAAFIWFSPMLVLLAVYYCAGNVLVPWLGGTPVFGRHGNSLAAVVAAQLDTVEPGLRLIATQSLFGRVRVDIVARDTRERTVLIVCSGRPYAHSLVKALELKFLLDSIPEQRIIVFVAQGDVKARAMAQHCASLSLELLEYTLGGVQGDVLTVSRIAAQDSRVAPRQSRRPRKVIRGAPAYETAVTPEEMEHLLGGRV